MSGGTVCRNVHFLAVGRGWGRFVTLSKETAAKLWNLPTAAGWGSGRAPNIQSDTTIFHKSTLHLGNVLAILSIKRNKTGNRVAQVAQSEEELRCRGLNYFTAGTITPSNGWTDRTYWRRISS